MFLMTGKKFSMTGKGPGIIFVDENAYPKNAVAWISIKQVVQNFMRNHKSKKYEEIVALMVEKY